MLPWWQPHETIHDLPKKLGTYPSLCTIHIKENWNQLPYGFAIIMLVIKYISGRTHGLKDWAQTREWRDCNSTLELANYLAKFEFQRRWALTAHRDFKWNSKSSTLLNFRSPISLSLIFHNTVTVANNIVVPIQLHSIVFTLNKAQIVQQYNPHAYYFSEQHNVPSQKIILFL